MPNVRLFQTTDGGNIRYTNGVIEADGGLETAAYLAMFGGNDRDDGRDDNPLTWWGNRMETDPAFQYRSETQFLLKSLPPGSANLRRLEDAARRDLAFFVAIKAASSVDAEASIPTVNKVSFKISVNIEGEEQQFEFVANWKANT